MTKIQKIVLVSKSTGQRGQDGKKKVYEITATTNGAFTIVRTEWGMAEKTSRQSQVVKLGNSAAQLYVVQKITDKVGKGYDVAYSA